MATIYRKVVEATRRGSLTRPYRRAVQIAALYDQLHMISFRTSFGAPSTVRLPRSTLNSLHHGLGNPVRRLRIGGREVVIAGGKTLPPWVV
jgi:hypothetical protein